ncbi:hypothetical protein [Brevundimonas sp.]|uniref:hypothetical protein n=1 Tax=Brevundimonas sp. TaxID=1871086 RepID=UPI0026361FEA|nr:hypothetical protein [Brevundimonas sp.]
MSEAEAATGPHRSRRAPDPLAGNAVWDLWQELMALYPLWRSMLASLSPRSPFRRETSWFWFDVIRGMRSMPSSRAVVTRLERVGDGDLDAVIGLAEINSRRQEHFLRTLVLSYITVPFAVGAIWAELAPGQMIGLMRNPELAAYWGGGTAGLFTALVIRFVADWRARSFVALLQIARTERRADAARPPVRPERRPGSRRPTRSA